MNRTFADQLDVRHEHLIPFANGVLDLEHLELRNGRPDDMLLRGPTYPWVDFLSSDPEVEELEPGYILVDPHSSLQLKFHWTHPLSKYTLVGAHVVTDVHGS